jgi:prepilin-type processing-associated H-X9-DG protein
MRSLGGSRVLAKGPADPVNGRFGSWHPGVCPFVMCDGSVQMIRNTLDGTMLARLADRRDGGVVTID